jgi:hypothetical protein
VKKFIQFFGKFFSKFKFRKSLISDSDIRKAVLGKGNVLPSN